MPSLHVALVSLPSPAWIQQQGSCHAERHINGDYVPNVHGNNVSGKEVQFIGGIARGAGAAQETTRVTEGAFVIGGLNLNAKELPFASTETL